MFKLNEDLTTYGKLAAAMLLVLALVGCGSGGGADNILCGGDPCSTDTTDDSTDEIDNIEDEGEPDSIEYVSASPTQMSIQGAGGDETSVVTFMVTDTAGDPISGIEVTFALNTSAGGVSLASTSDTTNTDGEASTIVQAGTVATSVRVIATVSSLSGETVSDALIVSTGIADFDSFSLAFSSCYPHAWDYVGNTVDVSARTGDVFNNPPPDGTQVSFFTEGGLVEASCSLIGGACSAVWTGQNPRAIEGVRQGRSAVLISMTGAESFTDVNSNGVFDDGDIFDTTAGYFGVDPQDDRPEPWLDNNENRVYDSGEFFVDFNGNGVWDMENGLYDGPLCEHSSLCSGQSTIAIGRNGDLIMAGGEPVVTLVNNPLSLYPIDAFVTISDENGGTLPAGTTISISTDNGELLTSSVEDIVDCGDGGASEFNIQIASDGVSDVGTFSIVITTPTIEETHVYSFTD